MRGTAVIAGWSLLGIFGGSTLTLLILFLRDERQWRRIERRRGA